jgi:hypothetical protein
MPANPSQLFASHGLQRLLDELKNQSDVMVIDSPPVLVVADPTLLARQVDGVLLVLKAGQGQEMISPEGMLERYLLYDGDAGLWMFKGMMLLRAAQLMNLTDVEIMKGQADAQAKSIKPILDVMEQARKDMDAAAQRARESNMEVAEAAAMGAAGGVLGRIDARFEELRQKKTDIAMAPDPMKGLMARTMETVMNQLTGMLTGQRGQVPGLVDERGKPGTGVVPGMTDTRREANV